MITPKKEEKLKLILLKKKIILTNREFDNTLIVKNLSAKEILAGIKANPRLLGPAIVLLVQHKKVLEELNDLPKYIIDTVLHLRRGDLNGPDCRYEKYEKLYQLCEISSDGRVKGVHKKIRKNFRFNSKTIERLHRTMKKNNLKTETEAIEYLIEKS